MEAYTNAALTNLPREGFEHPDKAAPRDLIFHHGCHPGQYKF
jgi:hypothetical protein